jgi:AIPR protein
MQLLSQTTHRQSYIDKLTEDIREYMSRESQTFHIAATRVLLQWLRYDLDDVTFIDGSDRGIDAWQVTDSAIDIFQFKTHELRKEAFLNLGSFDGQGVHDLERAKTFLLHEKAINVQSKKLKQLLQQRDSAIRTRQYEDGSIELPITLHLIILGDKLTPQAFAEFQALQASNTQPIVVDGVPVQLHAVLHTVDQIIDEKWREENRDWFDNQKRRYDRINLRPGNEGYINDNANAVFYCSAIDLVNAYDALGYQLFEPNVRANIKNSRVNHAIRESVSLRRSRKEFRFLNNGVTITCDSFTKPSSQRAEFIVHHPGIVNGLQTVVALHTAYQQLDEREKDDFVKSCTVLVRLLVKSSVEDITRVVKATNNQNPMKARNLVSNNLEQLIYTRIFASELEWFYEAKEGAWDAFVSDPRRWRPDLNKRPKDFRFINSRRDRRVDNESLAQAWLAFIGFASEAVNEKKEIFGRFYPLIFKQQTRRHAVDYDFDIKRAREEAVNQSPQAHLMLVAYLTQKFATEMALSASQNRQEARERLGIEENSMTSRAELDARLSQDTKFLLNQALSGMSLLFTEFVGFILYRALGDNFHQYGPRILKNHSFHILATQYAIDEVKEKIETGIFAERDLLVVLWLAFVDTIEDMIAGGWGPLYRAASIKVRFIFNQTDTRERLYRDIQNTNDFMRKRSLKKTWAVGVAEGQGLYEFVKSCII